jgi:putative ABC transport system permease protein
MSIGVAAVVMLTALGDGARRYVVGEFSSLGTNLVIVLPGAPAPAASIRQRHHQHAARPDHRRRRRPARAPPVSRVAPLTVGTSEISYGGRLREVMVAGSTAEFIEVRNFELAQGRFLPEGDWNRGARSP